MIAATEPEITWVAGKLLTETGVSPMIDAPTVPLTLWLATAVPTVIIEALVEPARKAATEPETF
jgi:hypothetical protein